MSTIKAGDTVRVKTYDELGGRRPYLWNSEGRMDYLYGTEQKVISTSRERVYVQASNQHRSLWSLEHSHVELVEDKSKWHKHHDIIIEWAKGAKVQGRPIGKSKWLDITTTTWSDNWEYRVKPDNSYKIAEIDTKMKNLAEEMAELSAARKELL